MDINSLIWAGASGLEYFTSVQFEKILNRELTLEEKMLVKKAYKFGRTYTFDIPKNNKKSIP